MATRPNLPSALLACIIALAPPTHAASIADELVTRTYKLDIPKIQKLPETILFKRAPLPPTSPADLLRALLSQEGIALPTNSTTDFASLNKNQKGFYFDDVTGELRLRATRRDIPKFEKHLAALSPDPLRTQIDPADTRLGTTHTFHQMPGEWWGAIEPEISRLPLLDPPQLTLELKPIFAHIISINGLTNIVVLNTKIYQTNLARFPDVPIITATDRQGITNLQSRRVRMSLEPERQYIPSDPPTIPLTFMSRPGPLIIRSESDLR